MRVGMTAKIPGERWRYIAFEIKSDTPFTRNEFLDSMVRKAKGTAIWNNFRITVFEGRFGILKVSHRLRDDAIAVIESVDSVRGIQCSVRTLKTSGTIKTLKTKYKRYLEAPRTNRH